MDLWPSILFTCCIDFVLLYSRRALQYRNVWQWIFRNLGFFVTLAKFFMRKRKLPCLVLDAVLGNTVLPFLGKLKSISINCLEMVIIRAFPFFDAFTVTLFLFWSRSEKPGLGRVSQQLRNWFGICRHWSWSLRRSWPNQTRFRLNCRVEVLSRTLKP